MQKIVVNKCYGGFGLSPEATLLLWQRGVPGIATPVDKYYGTRSDDDSILGRKQQLETWRAYLANLHGSRRSLFLTLTVFSPDESLVLYARGVPRDHPELIRVVEEMGAAANGACSSLEITEIPDGVDWQIEEYDGREWISEKHRTW